MPNFLNPIIGAARAVYDKIEPIIKKVDQSHTNDCDGDSNTIKKLLLSLANSSNYTSFYLERNKKIKLIQKKYKDVYDDNCVNVVFEGDSWLDYGPAIPANISNIDLKNRIVNYYNQNYKKHVTYLDLAKYGDVTGYMVMNDYKNEDELTTLNKYYDETISKKSLEKNYKPYLNDVLRNYAIDILIFSGGGNNILASNLKEILSKGTTDKLIDVDFKNDMKFKHFFNSKIANKEFKIEYDDIGKFCVAHQDKFDLNTIFNRFANIIIFNQKLDVIYEDYKKMVDFVKMSKNPNLKILGHTYDYALFRENSAMGLVANRPNKQKESQNKISGSNIGPWIKPYFDEKQIHSRVIRALVIIYMINRFQNDVLEKIKIYAKSINVDFDYVDLHKTFFDSNFMTDEIHPSTIGSKYLFHQFNKKLLPAFLEIVYRKNLDVFVKTTQKVLKTFTKEAINYGLSKIT